MKEKGPIRSTLEKAAKVWTVISIPLELYLLGHGVLTGNHLETVLGAGGLIGDLFLFKWLGRKKRQEGLQSTAPLQITSLRGSQRFRTLAA